MLMCASGEAACSDFSGFSSVFVWIPVLFIIFLFTALVRVSMERVNWHSVLLAVILFFLVLIFSYWVSVVMINSWPLLALIMLASIFVYLISLANFIRGKSGFTFVSSGILMIISFLCTLYITYDLVSSVRSFGVTLYILPCSVVSIISFCVYLSICRRVKLI